MDEKPLISIIVPVYNLEKYISDCIDSILLQTYSNIELILVDDGSSDSSPLIIDGYAKKDQRVKVIHKENGGVSSARNVGIEAANGDYIGFIDGDDTIDVDMYEKLITNALENNADISHVTHDRIYSDGKTTQITVGCGKIVQNRGEALAALLDGVIDPTDCTKIYRSSIAKKHRFDPHIAINEDLLFNFLCFNDCEVSVYEDECKYHYYIRSTSSSRKRFKEKNLQDQIDVKEKILDVLNGTSLQSAAEKAYINTYLTVYKSLICNGGEGHEAYNSELKEKIKSLKAYYHYLTPKRKVLLFMLLYCPSLIRKNG